MAPSASQTFPFARNDKYHPAPELAKRRQECPVSKVSLFAGSEAWLLTKHEDIKEALNSSHLSADRRTPGYPEIHAGGTKAREQKPTFVNLDDPAHAEQRAMLEDAFEPKAIERMQPMIDQTVKRCLWQMINKHEQTRKPVDLIEEFAAPVPTQIIYRMLGVPEEDVEELSKDSSVRTGTSRTAAEQANNSLQQYMNELVEKRIQEPKDDLISKLVKEQYRNGKLEKDDVVNLAFLVLTAGNAAMINSIGLGVLTLLEHPQQIEKLRQHPQAAVNELLRYNTASALNSRRAASQNLSIGGQKIEKGDGVICAVQAGDRDEDVTKNAGQFDIDRQYGQEEVLGFGYGPHRCQGEWLSRAELTTAFKMLFAWLPDLKLAVSEDDLEYTPPTHNIGVLGLPVTFSIPKGYEDELRP